MTAFSKALGALLRDQRRLKELMRLEKQRRVLDVDSLVFVGVANVAQHWWCTQQAVMRSRENELGFFSSYLEDRIKYAHELGIVKSLPRRNAALLEVGKEITLADMSKLLDKRAKEQALNTATGGANVTPLLLDERTDRKGNRLAILNPKLNPVDVEMFTEQARGERIQVVDIDGDPLLRGRYRERERAEKYPTIEWNFEWRRYIVVGFPDGITEDFVYEFKTAGSRFLLDFSRPVATAQADICGYFFRRPSKRVQILVNGEDKPDTIAESIDKKRAEETLIAFAQVAEGGKAIPPVPWKCKKCDYRESCPIIQADILPHRRRKAGGRLSQPTLF